MFKRTMARDDVEPISKSIRHILEAKVSFSKLLVFNSGDKYLSPNLKKGPDIIPQVIHQIQLGGKMSKARSYFFEKTQKMFPNYEMKLWGEANITKLAFPQTYEILRNLLKLQDKNQKKQGSISALMRHEILFHKGGFFRDTSLNIMKPVFVKFLKYNIVVAAEQAGRHRWSQGMSFYASAPRVGHLKRMASFRNLNKMRIYSENALDHCDFRQAVNGYE